VSIFSLFLKATAVGAANVVPGISGATLAVIFRVYDRLIAAINGLMSDRRASLAFLIPFGLGMGVGIVAVGSIISILIGMFSFQSAGFIAGLMAGSIPFLYGQAASRLGETSKALYYAALLVAAVVIAALAIFAPTPELYIEGTLSIGIMVLLFIGGFLAAAAMIVPGVSGAMVLILLGIYPLAMDTINQIRAYLSTPFDFSLLPPILRVVIPVGLGIIPGILLASRGIAVLLEKYFSLTYFIIIGLVFGTIFALFADPRTYESGEVTILSTVTTVIAFLCAMLLALRFGKKQEAAETEVNT